MLRRNPQLDAMTMLCAWLFAAAAEAQFIFLRITTEPGSERRADVFFGEQATAGDPQFIDKITHTKLWVQRKSGEFTPSNVSKKEDHLEAPLPGGEPLAVVGFCEYGVLKRDVPFLLRYYPKAVAGDAATVNRFKPHPDLQFEIIPTVAGDEISFVARHRGKPLPGATFNTVDDDSEGEGSKRA